MANPRKPPHATAALVQYYFDLRGLPVAGPTFRRHLRAAKEVLELAGGDLALAKKKVNVLKRWAEEKKLGWNLDTLVKRWPQIIAELVDQKERDANWESYRKEFFETNGFEPTRSAH